MVSLKCGVMFGSGRKVEARDLVNENRRQAGVIFLREKLNPRTKYLCLST